MARSTSPYLPAKVSRHAKALRKSVVRRDASGAAATAVTPWRWAVWGSLVGMLVALVVFAPAQWLAYGLGQGSQGHVQLRDAQGTVWTGTAQLVLSGGSGSEDLTALPARVSWRLRPSYDGLTLSLGAACCLAQDWQWHISPGIGSVLITPADIAAANPSRWPSSVLAGLGTPWNTLQLEGTLALSVQQLRMEWADQQWKLQGEVQLDAQQMSTRLSTLKPMGSYRLNWQGGTAPTLALRTLDGSLQLSGQGGWVGGRLQFNGEATAAPERSEALANLLNIIGRRDGARAIIKVG